MCNIDQDITRRKPYQCTRPQTSRGDYMWWGILVGAVGYILWHIIRSPLFQ